MSALIFAPTCGRCEHWEMTAQIGIGTCYGSPPTPVIVGMTPNGPQLALLRPQMQSTDRACALFKRKLAPTAEHASAPEDDTRPGARLVLAPADGEA